VKLLEGCPTIEDLDAFLEALNSCGEAHDCAVQAFDAELIVSRRQLEMAVERATRARQRGTAVADDPAVEILLYAAGRRQISRALELGVEAGTGPLLVVVDANDGGAQREAACASALCEVIDALAVLDAESRIQSETDVDAVCSYFDIGDAERAATDADLSELVCERVALLDVEK